MNCLAWDGTTIHMRQRNGEREVVIPRRGTCPTCNGTGKMPTAPDTQDSKAAAAAEGQ